MSSQRAQQRLAPEAAAAAESDLLLSSMRNAGFGAWRWNMRSGEVEWSSQTYRIFGLARGSAVVTYEGCMDRVHPADRAGVAAKIGHAAETCGGNFMEFRIRRLDGAVRSVICTSQVIPGDDGKPAMMTGLICDVTDRKDAPAPLAQAEPAEQGAVAFSTREVATLLGIAEASVKRLADSGQLPCLRSETRGVRRFSQQHVLGFLRTESEARATAPTTAAAAKPFAAAAARNDPTGAVALALELYGAGVGLESTLDLLVTPAVEGAAPGFIETFLERAIPLGPHQKRSGATAVVIPVGHPAPIGPALITCLLRSRGYETLKLIEELGPLRAAQAAARSGARLVVLVFAGVLLAEEEEEALQVAAQLAAAMPADSLCAYGPRLRSLPPGVVPIRTMRDLARITETGR